MATKLLVTGPSGHVCSCTASVGFLHRDGCWVEASLLRCAYCTARATPGSLNTGDCPVHGPTSQDTTARVTKALAANNMRHEKAAKRCSECRDGEQENLDDDVHLCVVTDPAGGRAKRLNLCASHRQSRADDGYVVKRSFS